MEVLMDLTSVLVALIALCAALLTAFVIPWLRTKTSTQQLTELMYWVEIAVAAAQQIYYTADGPDRLEYALRLLKEKGYDVDSNEVRDAVEAAVLKLHQSLLVPKLGTSEVSCL